MKRGKWKTQNQLNSMPRRMFCSYRRQMCCLNRQPKACRCSVFSCYRDAAETAHHGGLCGRAGVWAQSKLWDLHHGLWKLKDVLMARKWTPTRAGERTNDKNRQSQGADTSWSIPDLSVIKLLATCWSVSKSHWLIWYAWRLIPPVTL